MAGTGIETGSGLNIDSGPGDFRQNFGGTKQPDALQEFDVEDHTAAHPGSTQRVRQEIGISLRLNDDSPQGSWLKRFRGLIGG